jgi:hypothetical protein
VNIVVRTRWVLIAMSLFLGSAVFGNPSSAGKGGKSKKKPPWECTLAEKPTDNRPQSADKKVVHPLVDNYPDFPVDPFDPSAVNPRPPVFTRLQVDTALQPVKTKIQCCHQRYRVQGVADVLITVAPDGTVIFAYVSGEFEKTPTGACVEGAVKTAVFPKFQGDPETFPGVFLVQ